MSNRVRQQTVDKRGASPGGVPGRFAYAGLDRTLHERARLGIVTSLATQPEGRRFKDLKELCGLTDGNLSRHLDLLAAAGVVEVWKGFEDRRPQTLLRLSTQGRDRLVTYLHVLAQVIKDATPSTAHRAARTPEAPAGFLRR